MNKMLRLLPLSLYVSLMVYAGCSGSDEPDEPKPFNCSGSNLALTLAANGDIDPTTCVANDGSIQVQATGGKEPYTFSLGAGSFGNAPLFSNLGAGVFSITVKDANGCTKKIDVLLNAPGAPAVTVESTEDTNCGTPGNATITVSATGGSGSYQYKLNNGAFGSATVFENISAGGHTITVKDDEDCIVTVNKTVAKGDTGVDYVNDILPIFQAKCNFPNCHPSNGNWFSFSEAKANADKIKTKTANGDMPKGGSDAPGGALSATQKALIACWVDGGAPEN